MLSRLGLSQEELTLAQEMFSRLPSSTVRLLRACALVSAYIVRPDTDWPDKLDRIPDSDVEEVLSLLNGRVLSPSSLDLEDQLYIPEPARPFLDDDEMLTENIWKSGEVAIKRVRLEYASVRELAVMCSLKHPHILSATGFYFEDGDIYICIALQEGGDLSDLIYSKHTTSESLAHSKEVWEEGRPSSLWVVPLQERRRLARELLEGLSYLHSQRVVHGDIKPQNLFLDRDYTLRVADFGECLTYAVPLQDGEGSPLRSYERYTRGYRDPNVETLRYSFEADIWATAITLLEMETGIIPPEEVRWEGFNLDAVGSDTQFVTLIEMMIDEPLERVTAEQALALLR